jgi:hypothetical protein
MPADPVHQSTDLGDAGDEEIGAHHCLGMCADWAGHPACEGEPGLQQFLIDCAEGLRWQRDEIARLRATLELIRQDAWTHPADYETDRRLRLERIAEAGK